MSNMLPRITPAAEKAIKQLTTILVNNPDALKDKNCDYNPDLIQTLNILIVTGKVDVEEIKNQIRDEEPPVTEDDNAEIEDIDIGKESMRIYREITAKMKTMKNAETSEQIALYRVATTLLEKLLNVKERDEGAEHFKAMKMFFISAMERYLNDKQKTEFLDELKKVLQLD